MAFKVFSTPSPAGFNGENFPLWAVKMKAYLKAFDLWDAVETCRDPPPFRENPTIAQIHQHSEESAKKYEALAAIHLSISEPIFTRIVNCETAKQSWDQLKQEFQGSDRTRQIQVLNLWREFEILRMSDSETLKNYTERLMRIVNQLRLHGEDLLDRRIVSKVLVRVPSRFDAKILSLEDSRDLSTITLTVVMNVFQAIQQRISIMHEEASEGTFMARLSEGQSSGGKKHAGEYKVKEKKYSEQRGGKKDKYPPCTHCKKKSHAEKTCWFRPDVQFKACNQFGHIARFCKRKENISSRRKWLKILRNQLRIYLLLHITLPKEKQTHDLLTVAAQTT